MRFLLDENAEHRIGGFLRSLGHDVTAIVTDYERGLGDRQVLAIADAEKRILLTNDQDFWDLALTQGRPHAGIVIFRLGKIAKLREKIDHLQQLLELHADDLDAVITIMPDELHIRRADDPGDSLVPRRISID